MWLLLSTYNIGLSIVPIVMHILYVVFDEWQLVQRSLVLKTMELGPRKSTFSVLK